MAGPNSTDSCMPAAVDFKIHMGSHPSPESGKHKAGKGGEAGRTWETKGLCCPSSLRHSLVKTAATAHTRRLFTKTAGASEGQQPAHTPCPGWPEGTGDRRAYKQGKRKPSINDQGPEEAKFQHLAHALPRPRDDTRQSKTWVVVTAAPMSDADPSMKAGHRLALTLSASAYNSQFLQKAFSLCFRGTICLTKTFAIFHSFFSLPRRCPVVRLQS
ncbi:uncharacterized protein LOC116481547 [Hylobates moloch]|uniref:uncharacterized protein LOC116481547 n=1 Tax=Hylobates moloch TaxID=81572 RepID=UPI002676E1CB|nr:uncharacterized protein LOC116481547 [Hylobates moloch]